MEITERDTDGEGFQFAPNSTDMRVTSANPRLVGRFARPVGIATLTMGFDATNSEYVLDIPEYFFQHRLPPGTARRLRPVAVSID